MMIIMIMMMPALRTRILSSYAFLGEEKKSFSSTPVRFISWGPAD